MNTAHSSISFYCEVQIQELFYIAYFFTIGIVGPINVSIFAENLPIKYKQQFRIFDIFDLIDQMDLLNIMLIAMPLSQKEKLMKQNYYHYYSIILL